MESSIKFDQIPEHNIANKNQVYSNKHLGPIIIKGMPCLNKKEEGVITIALDHWCTSHNSEKLFHMGSKWCSS